MGYEHVIKICPQTKRCAHDSVRVIRVYGYAVVSAGIYLFGSYLFPFSRFKIIFLHCTFSCTVRSNFHRPCRIQPPVRRYLSLTGLQGLGLVAGLLSNGIRYGIPACSGIIGTVEVIALRACRADYYSICGLSCFGAVLVERHKRKSYPELVLGIASVSLKIIDLCPISAVVCRSPQTVSPRSKVEYGIVVRIDLQSFSAAAPDFISSAAEGQLKDAPVLTVVI